MNTNTYNTIFISSPNRILASTCSSIAEVNFNCSVELVPLHLVAARSLKLDHHYTSTMCQMPRAIHVDQTSYAKVKAAFTTFRVLFVLMRTVPARSMQPSQSK